MEFKDYYKLLGVDRSASQDELKKAFRRLSREYHPDVNQNPGAEDRFKEINEAYEVLKDPQKRKQYDMFGSNYRHGQQFDPSAYAGGGFDFSSIFGGGGGGPSRGRGSGGRSAAFSDFFEAFFGAKQKQAQWASQGGAPGAQKGEDLETRLTLTLDELYHGGSKKIAIDLEGRGTPSELTIKIPPGTKDGMKIRLTGKGRPSRMGGPAGDLLLSVEVRPQAEASVDEFDITLPLKLAPWEAALGGKVEFATIDGSVMLSVPAGVSSGQKMRLKGKGLQKSDGSRGLLYAEIQIAIPKTLSADERRLLEDWKSISTFNPRGDS